MTGSDPSHDELTVRIYLSGCPKDLLTLAMLCPQRRLAKLYVTTVVTSET